MDLTTLHISELIVHDVPEQRVTQKSAGPVVSEVPSALDNDIRSYFGNRLTQTLERNAAPVEYDPDTSSKVPEELVGVLTTPGEFVARSQALAMHLFNAQTGSNPGGLLIIGLASWFAKPAAIVLKLEREEALSLSQKPVTGGMTFDMAHLRNLMLGNRTRVFKAGLFGMARTVADLQGFVSDTQGGYGRESEVAHFFLSKFLGCRRTEAPDITTRRFLDVLDEVVNVHVADPALKARYRIAAVAALQDKAIKLSPRAFAANHLEQPAEQAFFQVAKDRGLPLAAFEKDLRLVRTRVERMGFRFANGIEVTGTADSIESSVEVHRRRDGVDDMHIRGEITKVK
ncbi:MAG: nucleoid-associated protein [Candidatus Limnocylindrales bacterium]|nr:nucleoid-associated protein [Candidatus Limnocylindrales bacterium]